MGFSRPFPKFAILKTADFTTFHFEKRGDGVGYCGGCFGMENDALKIENAAPFPDGIDTRPVLAYRSMTIWPASPALISARSVNISASCWNGICMEQREQAVSGGIDWRKERRRRRRPDS